MPEVLKFHGLTRSAGSFGHRSIVLYQRPFVMGMIAPFENRLILGGVTLGSTVESNTQKIEHPGSKKPRGYGACVWQARQDSNLRPTVLETTVTARPREFSNEHLRE